MSDMVKIKGYCPQGCGETIFVGEGGHLTCSWKKCPHPASLDELLGNYEIGLHVVSFDVEGRFAIQHPLAERLTLGGELFLCPLHSFLARAEPKPAGRYSATTANGPLGWDLEPLA